MRSYCHKLHALPFDQYDELCAKIDDMAKNLTTTGDVVLCAMFLIDRRIKNNENPREERVTKSLLNIVEVNNAKKLETVSEDDSVKLPFTSTTSRPPVIIKSVPLTTLLLVMVETVLSDDMSEVSLRDELKFQHKEQKKVTQAILD